MDDEVGPLGHDVQVVDPDVRGYVYSLVTALGGFNGENADQYILGDDALACLRDIKRWLKLYDEKNNRMDVARCLGEANLVNGDLLPILSTWWASGQKSKHMTRVALACLELLVPLTWPVEFHSQMTVNHHRHTPYIQQAQVQYKRGILKHDGSNLLRTIVRIALPSMAIPRSDRETRDEGIIKLMLYLLRNMAVISSNVRLAAEGDEEETSRSSTINAFQGQDAFALLLTMCSNIGEDFNLQDVVLLEILFHLVKGVNVDKLFMDEDQRKVKRTDELGDLLRKENSLQREYAKTAPTRHGRFGTMIWVKRDEAKVSTVSGQDTLRDSQTTLNKMDQSKKWNKPRTRRRQEEVVQNNNFNMPIHLSSLASKNLRTFVEEFLDSGFNPLFTHVRKAIEREADRVMDINTRQFFYTVSWLLEAERARRVRQQSQRAKNAKTTKDIEPDSYGLVAGVLNQETFISLNRAMQNSMDNKEWEDLNAQMRCFTQILLTVQEMAASPLDEDQEIAENIQNRIFYEETTHDRIIAIMRGYKDQGFGYLDACTELVHVFLRMLERYSKENADMQVRSRRRAKRSKKKADQISEQGGAQNDDEQNSEAEDMVDTAQVIKERSFDFKRFAAKFCNQKCVDTFVAFTGYYRELNSEQLKRAHRYFYRIAFKQEMTVLLFRLDIISLFYRMIKGPEGLDSSKPIFKEWEELVRQIIRRLLKKLDQRPALITELLFSKINSTVFYLEYGHERQTLSTVKRPPAELEITSKEATTKEARLGIVVGALVLDGRADLVKWIGDVLRSAASEREDWEAQDEARRAESTDAIDIPNPMIAVKARDEFCQNAMFSNAKLRLLMALVGFERLGVEDIPGASWVIPATMTSKDLHETISAIHKALQNPLSKDSELDPRQHLRRKETGSAWNRGAQDTFDVNFGSDSEGEDNVPDGPLFPPNPRSKSNALDDLKKKCKKKQKNDSEKEPLDDGALEARREARLTNALARQAKIKSDLFIHDSDEETDEEADKEFFRLEEKRGKEQAEQVKKALLTASVEKTTAKGNKSLARKRNSGAGTSTAATKSKRQRRSSGSAGSDGDGDGDGDGDILMAELDAQSPHSQHVSTSRGAREDEDTPITSGEDDLDFDDDLAFSRDRKINADTTAPGTTADADEDTPVAAPRRRMRGGFVIESDSE